MRTAGSDVLSTGPDVGSGGGPPVAMALRPCCEGPHECGLLGRAAVWPQKPCRATLFAMTLRGKFCTARRTGRRGLAGATIDRLDTGRACRVATHDKIFRI